MSEAAPPSELSRDDLEDEVRTLRGRVDELEAEVNRLGNSSVDTTVLNHLLERLIPQLEVDDYTADPMQQLATVEEYGQKLVQTVDAVEENPQNPSGDAMTQNWRDVVEHARTLRNNPNHARQDGWVALYGQDVADATDNSNRWGRQLIEELGDNHEGAKWRPAKENPKPGAEDRQKALLVNMDVWGDSV